MKKTRRTAAEVAADRERMRLRREAREQESRRRREIKRIKAERKWIVENPIGFELK